MIAADRFAVAARPPNWVDVLSGALMYVSTLFFASNALLLLVLLLVALTAPKIEVRQTQWLTVVFVGVALLNMVLHVGQFDPERHVSSPAVVLVCAMAIVAPSIRVGAFKVLVALTCLEVFVALYEYMTGRVAMFEHQAAMAGQDALSDSTYLYDLRAFGLSANSSLLAEKVFLSIAFVFVVPEAFRRRWHILAILAVGLYVSFNRTAIFGTALLVGLYLLSWSGTRIRRLLLVAVLASLAGGLAVFFIDAILDQFMRGAGELTHSELSRLYFWQRSFDMIVTNPFFGNGSLTFRIDDPVTGLPQHAHNSMLVLLATHGLVPALLLIAYVALQLDARNWRIMAAFALFSVTQYFVFWNLSVPDLFMYWLLGRETSENGLRRLVCADRDRGNGELGAAVGP